MAKKLRVGILYGGRSGEHDVSLMSAASILGAIDRKKYEVVPIGITRQGRWVTGADAERLLAGKAIAPAKKTSLLPSPEALDVDVMFPVLHGTFGEDGTVQGLFDLAGVAYVGSGVLGSAAGMDKSMMKSLFSAYDLPTVKSFTLHRSELDRRRALTKEIEEMLRYPMFAKPANLGSSVGISKVHDRAELLPAIRLAAKYDSTVIIEEGISREGIKPREFEVAVLGNHEPVASVVGEIVPGKEFYDYEAKYLSDGSVPVIPADIPKELARECREHAITAFFACELAGLARVDFLYDPETRALALNEVNTLPGFTAISMYPKLWQASGLAYRDLITRLIELAMERAAERASLSYARE